MQRICKALFLSIALVIITIGVGAQTSEGSGEVSGMGVGCFADKDCKEDESCFFPLGSCGEDGQAGTCGTRPEICILVLAPVCSCDAQTHDNACFAAAAGASIRHRGPCE